MKTRRTFSVPMELCKAAVLVFVFLFVLASPTYALPTHQDSRPDTSEPAAAVRIGHPQDGHDAKFCRRHYELVAAKDAHLAAYNTLFSCEDECDALLEAYDIAHNGELDAEQRYNDTYRERYNEEWEGRWLSYWPDEDDPFWQWCLGLGGPPEIALTPEATVTPEVAPTPEPGAAITLRAYAENYDPVTDVIDNSINFGSVSISGRVTDLNTGAAIGGATIQIASGASSASTV